MREHRQGAQPVDRSSRVLNLAGAPSKIDALRSGTPRSTISRVCSPSTPQAHGHRRCVDATSGAVCRLPQRCGVLVVCGGVPGGPLPSIGAIDSGRLGPPPAMPCADGVGALTRRPRRRRHNQRSTGRQGLPEPGDRRPLSGLVKIALPPGVPPYAFRDARYGPRSCTATRRPADQAVVQVQEIADRLAAGEIDEDEAAAREEELLDRLPRATTRRPRRRPTQRSSSRTAPATARRS